MTTQTHERPTKPDTEGKMRKRKDFTPDELIQLWANYQAGGVSGIQLRIRPNGNGGAGDGYGSLSLAAAQYIESVRTYRYARSFLLWLHAPSTKQCDGLGGGDITKIGNAFHGQEWPRLLADAGLMYMLGYPKPQVAQTVLDQFMGDLVDKMRATPFEFGGCDADEDAPIPSGATWTRNGWKMAGAK
jgi:hypothetical protein